MIVTVNIEFIIINGAFTSCIGTSTMNIQLNNSFNDLGFSCHIIVFNAVDFTPLLHKFLRLMETFSQRFLSFLYNACYITVHIYQ